MSTTLDVINGKGPHNFNPSNDTRGRYLGARHQGYKVRATRNAHGLLNLHEYSRDQALLIVVLLAEVAGAYMIVRALGLDSVLTPFLFAASLALDLLVVWALSRLRRHRDKLFAFACAAEAELYVAESKQDKDQIATCQAHIDERLRGCARKSNAIVVCHLALFLMASVKIGLYGFGRYDFGGVAALITGETIGLVVGYLVIFVIHAFYSSWVWTGWPLVRSMKGDFSARGQHHVAGNIAGPLAWQPADNIDVELPPLAQLQVLDEPRYLLVPGKLTVRGVLTDDHVTSILDKQLDETTREIVWCACVYAQTRWLRLKDED